MQMTGIKDRLHGSDKPSDFSCLNKSIAAALFAFSHPFTIFMTSIPSKGVSEYTVVMEKAILMQYCLYDTFFHCKQTLLYVSSFTMK